MDTSSSSAASSAGTVQPDPVRPLLTTPFSDYNVTEGLLLAIFLTLLISSIIRWWKG